MVHRLFGNIIVISYIQQTTIKHEGEQKKTFSFTTWTWYIANTFMFTTSVFSNINISVSMCSQGPRGLNNRSTPSCPVP